jgi:hypothetical protein
MSGGFKNDPVVTYNNINVREISITGRREFSPGKIIIEVRYSESPLIFAHTKSEIKSDYGVIANKFGSKNIRFNPDENIKRMIDNIINGIRMCILEESDIKDFEMVTNSKEMNIKVKSTSSFFDKEYNEILDISALEKKSLRLYASISVPTVFIEFIEKKIFIQFVLDQAKVLESSEKKKQKTFTLVRDLSELVKT